MTGGGERSGSATDGAAEIRSSLHLVVDAANVVGSRPDGWWRDRAGAARRLAGEIVAVLVEDPTALVVALGREPRAELTVHLVLEGAAARVEDPPTHPRLDVVRSPADGDTAIAALVEELGGAGVLVVTADRGLRDRVHDVGAATIGPGTLLRALPGARADRPPRPPITDER